MRRHVVVDGSNIATEGRSKPSLRQLNDAVLAFIEENPNDVITVVVDATFGHRIDPREVAEFDAAVENNELVSPPAGAIGRGDAFVLTIANKADATILSNDSFQEFHADFGWLFDDGRLIGGKPVPNVGWVFVPRAPVRGPVSRRATRDAKKSRTATETKKAGRPSKLASEPMPEPKVPPPAKRGGRAAKALAEPAAVDGAETAAKPGVPAKRPAAAKPPAPAKPAVPAKRAEAPTGSKQAAVNDVLPYLEFVERHPVGTTVDATVESYSSHGAYASVGDVRCYIPLRYLGEPAPRSARDVVALGERRPFTVVSFHAARRGIDLALPGLQPEGLELPVPAEPAKRAARSRKKAVADVPAVEAGEPPKKRASRKKAAEPEAPLPEVAVPEIVSAKRSRAKKQAAPVPEVEAIEVATEAAKAPARRRVAKKAATVDATPEAVEPAKAVRKRAKKAESPPPAA
jgi:hypothetical protein